MPADYLHQQWSKNEVEKYPCKVCRKIARCITRVDQKQKYFGTTSELTDYALCKDHKEFIENAIKPELLKEGVVPKGLFQHPEWAISAGLTGIYVDYAAYGTAVIHELESPSNTDLIPIRGSCQEAEFAIGRELNEHWIDLGMIRDWYDLCTCEHGQKCSSQAFNLPMVELPWLIDTHNRCLVPGFPGARYVALSYVWGVGNRVSTTKTCLPLFQKEGALADGPTSELPQTIRDAIELAESLQERFLWIDNLCIVQDDEEHRDSLIRNMSSIYHNASLTIIAADGHDATWGLRGLAGISQPRQIHHVHGPGGSRFLLKPQGTLSDSKWNSRGWTFQEYLFSRRRLIFIDGTVRWECGQARWREEVFPESSLSKGDLMNQYDNDHSSIRTAHILRPPNHHPTQVAATLLRDSSVPDFRQLAALVEAYSTRTLTFDTDSLPAFQGVLSALEPFFKPGFIFGLPIAALDAALAWERDEASWLRRRRSNRGANAGSDKIAPPSWTWAGWAGTISVRPKLECLDKTIPLLNWCEWTGRHDDLPCPITHQNEWFPGERLSWDSLYPDVSSQESLLFTGLKPNISEDHSSRSDSGTHGRYLCARTQQVFMEAGQTLMAVPGREKWYRSFNGGGQLKMDDFEGQFDEIKKCHIVVISAGISTDWQCSDTRYPSSYTVLSVEWIGGIAYRRGIGCIRRDAWEALDWEWVDLVLG